MTAYPNLTYKTYPRQRTVQNMTTLQCLLRLLLQIHS